MFSWNMRDIVPDKVWGSKIFLFQWLQKSNIKTKKMKVKGSYTKEEYWSQLNKNSFHFFKTFWKLKYLQNGSFGNKFKILGAAENNFITSYTISENNSVTKDFDLKAKRFDAKGVSFFFHWWTPFYNTYKIFFIIKYNMINISWLYLSPLLKWNFRFTKQFLNDVSNVNIFKFKRA